MGIRRRVLGLESWNPFYCKPSAVDSLSEVVPTLSQIKTSGSDMKTVTCTGTVTSFGTTLNNKVQEGQYLNTKIVCIIAICLIKKPRSG